MSFRGTMAECLDLLPSGDSQTITEIAEFCGVSRISAGRWLGGRKYPKGEKRIRLCTLLDLSGFEVVEMARVERYSQVSHDLGRLIGFQVATPEEVLQALQSSAADSSHLWQVLHGNSRLMPRNEVLAKEFITAKQPELDVARQHAKPLTAAAEVVDVPKQIRRSSSRTPRRKAAPSPVVKDLAPVTDDEIDHVKALATYLRIALPLAELLVTDRFDELDRKRLRKLVGVEEFFNLTNLLHRLGSSRAREIYDNEGRR